MLDAAVYGRQSSNKAKSIEEQVSLGHLAIRDEGWNHKADYRDGRSASRFGTKVRSGWAEVVEAVKARAFDVLILWESSRGDRTPETWFAFLDSCRTNNVAIHVITHDRTYNLSNPREWKTLGDDGVNSAYESELLSMRTKRGHAGAAKAGLPPGGPTPYGYRRTFDPGTGKLLGQIIEEHQAEVVREITLRVKDGHSILGISNDLNARQVPAAGPNGWTANAIRRIARNPAYIGLRSHNGATHPGQWEPIVKEADFYAVQQILSQPERRITRPGSQKHLLSYLGLCEPCSGFLNQVVGCYRCLKGCVSIPKEHADLVVAEAVIGRLLRPNAAATLAEDSGDEAEQAEADAVRLRSQLDEWRRSAVRGQTTPASLAVIEAELTAQIESADSRARTLSAPAVVLDMLAPGVDVRQRWDAMTVVNRRHLVRAMCEIRVSRGRPGRYGLSFDPVDAALTRLSTSRWHRSELTWAEQT